MTTYTINSETSLQSCIGYLRDDFAKHKYIKVSTKTGKARSLDQNAAVHCWYEQLARELKEDDALGWKCFSKLHFGVPILRAEDMKFKQFYDGAVKGLSYEQKTSAMKFIPVTSIMNKTQLTKYASAMQELFAERGVRLEFIADE